MVNWTLLYKDIITLHWSVSPNLSALFTCYLGAVWHSFHVPCRWHFPR